jgi:hypothetical protein
MSLDVGELAKKMFEAFESSLTDKWPEIKDYAETEAKKMAESLVMKMKNRPNYISKFNVMLLGWYY